MCLNGRDRLGPAQIIVLGYLLLVAVGTGLLMLPWTTRDGLGAGFADALFTATSAITVTGLVVHDTARYWSAFGQAVLLLLIQVGGLGVVTMAVAVAVLSGQKIGFRFRWVMQESIAAPHLAGMVRTTRFICVGVLCVELVGALLLALRFCPQRGFGEGLWMAVFHSVSAFCNAGFDLMGEKVPFASLTAYTRDPLVCLVVAALIITGGLGFLTLDDVRRHGLRPGAYRLQSKLVLVSTAVLLAGGTLFFLCLEFSKERWDLSGGEALLVSFFHAVSPRTAGFNSVDLNALSPVSQFFTVVLMLVGAAPGSTGGGFKVTTLAVLVLALLSIFLNRRDVRGFDRRIGESTQRRAAAIFLFFVLLYLAGGTTLCVLDDLPLMTGFFEAASAIATVGLTLGVTPDLSAPSKVVLVLLMFFGRVGALTVLFAVSSNLREDAFRYPEEEVAVG